MQLLGEFGRDKTIPEKQFIRHIGEGDFTLGHGLEKLNYEAGYVATIGRGVGETSQCSQETIEMPKVVKNWEANKKFYDTI
jgi:hypothetical protein